MADKRWPKSIAEFAKETGVTPRTVRRRLREIEECFGVVCCTPVGRTIVFYEDDFERLREHLKRLARDKRMPARFTTSEAPLPGDGYTRALKLAAKIRKRGRKGRRPPGRRA